jgi:glucosamine-6-phosphate deaminase
MSAFGEAQIKILENPAAVSQYAADSIFRLLRSRSKTNLGTITGDSPLLIYDIFRSEPAEIFDGVDTYNLDEYCLPDGSGGYEMIDPDDDIAFQRVMREQLHDPIPNITGHFPDIENYKHPGAYDQLIKKMGGVQLALNGLGSNGHTGGFNESGSTFNSVTRRVEIFEDTRRVNSKKTGAVIPRFAISTGLATLMSAEKIITIAFGESKAQSVYDAIVKPRSVKYPLTVFRRHQDHELVIDEEAAQLIPSRYNRFRGVS